MVAKTSTGRTDRRPLVRSWIELQRREGEVFLRWLNRAQRLNRGFDALSAALRETLAEHVQTASDACAVWDAAPAVLDKCNESATYDRPYAEIAYAWLHLLDRYVRTWLAFEHVLLGRLLPMGRYGVRVLDVGTGPGSSAFATHDFYAAMEDYALIANASNWRQPTEITCVEPALGMNHIRHNIAERLAVKGASQSVLRIAEGLHDFSTIHPTRERKRLRDSLLNEYEEYWNEQREEWHAEPLYTPEEANWESNAHLRFRLFTFSNFLTTPDTVSAFQKNIEEILTDAAPGSVLLMIGGKWDHYATIRERMANLAGAGGFQRCNNAVTVASADAQLDLRLDEEVRWFYRRLTQLTGDLPTSEPAAADLRKELEGSQPITLKSSAVDAFRK